MFDNSPYHNGIVVEALSMKFRELQQEEALRQNSGLAGSDELTQYKDMPDHIKEFYRVIARHVLEKFAGQLETLQFYGNQENWIEIKETGVSSKNVMDDMGEKAREELKKLGIEF